MTTVLTALSITQQPLESFSVILHDGEVCCASVDALQTLPLHGALYRGLKSTFRHLQELTLALRYTEGNIRDAENKEPYCWLTNFVDLAPRFERLTLFFDGLRNDLKRPSWQNAKLLGAFAENAFVARLCHLELGNVQLNAEQLHLLLMKHASSLKKLFLTRVSLQGRDFHEPRWGRLFELLDSNQGEMQLTWMKLLCLYDTNGTVMVFNTDGVDGCVCLDSDEHVSFWNAVNMPCGHLRYESQGSAPTEVCLRELNDVTAATDSGPEGTSSDGE